MASTIGSTIQRRRIIIQGIVQGVGFRPFIYGQAQRRGLAGFVLNDSNGVTIEVEGASELLDEFERALCQEPPPLARIDSIVSNEIEPRNETSFTIAHSHAGAERNALISPDTATCDDCLYELFDPQDRRFGYPFTNCTNCGPRFTIVQDVPYDRTKTTMRVFPMCPACQQEYENPLNRRFHAQPNACPVCGPQVRLIDWKWRNDSRALSENISPITIAAQYLAKGAILAIKGLGGYHLACDALNVEAVQRLRQRKHREAKPFALMVPDLETARQICSVNDAEAQLLQSYKRPIVLLGRRGRLIAPIADLSAPARSSNMAPPQIAPDVAPAYKTLGIMLPYTPLHYLLLNDFATRVGPNRPAVLVMTSGNLSDEPIAYQDEDAQERLAAIADGSLTHNRAIHMRCDDSVVRVTAAGEQLFRRSRGYAPEPIPLSFDLPMPVLACGGHLKNTFCLGKGRQAFISHHIGDLENLETLTSFREGIAHFQRLFDIYPQAIAYDLHPEYLATKYALDTDMLQKIGVQHHHAHIASVLAEHGLQGPVIGVAADGTGYGTDGAVWGCEIMSADLNGFERLAHLAYVPLPGGEQAVRQPWRMAATYLHQAYGDAFLDLDIPLVHRLNRSTWRTLSQMAARGINSPATSSLGRLFDAVAALVGLPIGAGVEPYAGTLLYEGQAAIELEIAALASVPKAFENTQQNIYPCTLKKRDAQATLLDVTPMIRAIVSDIQQGKPVSVIVHCFHRTIAELLATTCAGVRAQTGMNIVALSGGVFQNRLLLEQLVIRLENMAFQVYINRCVPPNDGGLSLGQIAVAAARLKQHT
ncbi:MAG TPA: carbamoyltransferase HypF [Ktedonobacteraceae bacterium]|nr:carbamoyltransferase HypF [Ktedonobacteraceae bacterium]